MKKKIVLSLLLLPLLAATGCQTDPSAVSSGSLPQSSTAVGEEETSDSSAAEEEEPSSVVPGSAYVDGEFADVLENARENGTAYYTKTMTRVYDTETGETTSESFQYTKEVRTRDYLSQAFLESFEGPVIQGYSQAFVTREAYHDGTNDSDNAAVSWEMGPDGVPVGTVTSLNFDSTYPYCFDLVGEKDFVVDTLHNTATIVNGTSVSYYFLQTFAYLNFYTYSIQPMTFTYDDGTKALETAHVRAFEQDYTSGTTTEVVLDVSFVPLTEEDIFVPTAEEEDSVSLALDAKIQKTKEAFGAGNFTVQTEVLEGTKGVAGIQDSTLYYTDEILYQDVLLYNQNYGEYKTVLYNAGSRYWAQSLPVDPEFPARASSADYALGEVLPGFDFSGKLFKADGEGRYVLKDDRYLSNAALLQTILPFLDSYKNALINGAEKLTLLTDDDKVTGLELQSHISAYDETFLVRYTFKDFGTTVIPAAVSSIARRLGSYPKALDEKTMSNCTISFTESGFPVQVLVDGNKAKVLVNGMLTGYYVLEAYSDTVNRVYEYALQSDGTYTKTSRGNADTFPLALTNANTLDFPTIAEFANYGVVSEDGKSITIDSNASNHYEISLDDEGRIQTLLHEKSGESATYAITYGDVESFDLPDFGA